jgi:hypothetical protein
MAFVIKEHRPGRRLLLALVVIIVWLLSAWLAYETGWNQTSFDRDHAQSRHVVLQQELEKQFAINEQMQAQISILKRTAQVDRAAKEQIAKDLKALQELQADLREEIAFYKSIISPASGKSGLDVYNLSITPRQGLMYHFKMVLTQSGKSDSLVEGVVKMRLKGVIDGSEKELTIKDIQVAGTPDLSYKFRYFEELAGSFQLPEGYEAREVVITLIPKNGKRKNKLVKTFDWLNVRLHRDDNGW